MKLHITHEDNPRNSYETVLEVVERNKLEPKHGEAELLSEFIKLLGKEKEEWGGVKAMTVCVEEYRLQEPNVKDATCNDFERFLFSPGRKVIVIKGDEGSMTSKAVIEGDSPANRETRKELDRPSSSKAVKQYLSKASNTLKEPDHPSSSKAVKQDLLKASNTLKEPDRPSSSKAVKQYLPKVSNTLKEPDRQSSSKAVKKDLPKASNTLKEPDRPSSRKAVKQDMPKASNTLKEPDRPSSRKAVKQDLPKASNTLKEPDRPSSSKTVKHDLPKALNTLKGTDDPSTNIAIIPATNKKTLKVKIYMGTGWDTDFAKLRRGSSPDLFVNLMIHGGKIQKTVHKRSWTPSWGEQFEFPQFEFPLFSLENDALVAEVYDHTLIFKDKFAGKFRLSVSTLKAGIQVIPLSDEEGKQCRTARLLMRFMFV